MLQDNLDGSTLRQFDAGGRVPTSLETSAKRQTYWAS
jgi:hypothetical protein